VHLEFLGFQFSELQNKALFSRYDSDFTGEIDYMQFISTAMFYAAVEPDFGVHKSSTPATQHVDLNDVPDVDSKELQLMQELELKKVFNKVDREKRGSINRDDFELLLMAIGHNLTPHEIESCLHDMGIPHGGMVTFELFLDWWTNDMGMDAIRKRSRK